MVYSYPCTLVSPYFCALLYLFCRALIPSCPRTLVSSYLWALTVSLFVTLSYLRVLAFSYICNRALSFIRIFALSYSIFVLALIPSCPSILFALSYLRIYNSILASWCSRVRAYQSERWWRAQVCAWVCWIIGFIVCVAVCAWVCWWGVCIG